MSYGPSGGVVTTQELILPDGGAELFILNLQDIALALTEEVGAIWARLDSIESNAVAESLRYMNTNPDSCTYGDVLILQRDFCGAGGFCSCC
jgi:hypothetical protein